MGAPSTTAPDLVHGELHPRSFDPSPEQLLPHGARLVPNEPDPPDWRPPPQPRARTWRDDHAEQSLAAMAGGSLHAARLAAGRLDAGDFHDPRCWAVIQAGTQLPMRPAGVDETSRWREHAAADLANIDTGTIEAWALHAPVMWDTNGAIARRVQAAAAARRRITELLGELEDLGVAAAWGDQ